MSSGRVSTTRVDAILDTTEDLLLRWGSDRVTVGEIARRSRVGKGTVYLHWSTKEDLFRDAVARACSDVLAALVDSLERGPAQVRLSGSARLLVTLTMRRPLCRSLNLRDEDVLGRLVRPGGRQGLDELRMSALLSHPAYLGWLARQGLLRSLPTIGNLGPAVTAVVEGFLLPLADGLQEPHPRAVAGCAHQLEQVLQEAFESRGATVQLSDGAIAPVRDYFLRVRRQCESRAANLGVPQPGAASVG
jgi:AcrR family transcriptional regulator